MAKDKLTMAVDKLKMDYNLANAAAFTSGEGQVIVTDIILGNQEFTNSFIGQQLGVKYKEKLIDIGVGITIIQKTNDDVGSVVASGGSTLSDVDVEVVEECVKETYVPSKLNSKLAGKLLAAGSDPSNPLPLKDIVLTLKGLETGRLNSFQLWQGSKNSGSTNMNYFDGWLTKINASSGITSGGSAAAFTTSTVLASVAAFNKIVITKFPAWVQAGYAVFMSPAQFDTLYSTKFALNGVVNRDNLDPNGAPVTSYKFGSATYFSMQGMTGSEQIVATRLGNLVAVTDLVSETDTCKFEYLPEAEHFRLEIVFKLGAQIARLVEIIATL